MYISKTLESLRSWNSNGMRGGGVDESSSHQGEVKNSDEHRQKHAGKLIACTPEVIGQEQYGNRHFQAWLMLD